MKNCENYIWKEKNHFNNILGDLRLYKEEMALLELTISVQIEAYLDVIAVYSEFSSRLENSGGEICNITEMLRELQSLI